MGVMDGDTCPAEVFLATGEKATQASRLGMFRMLEFIAERGLQEAPSSWYHEADKALGIYELIKGDLRLFFFKGQMGEIAVFTSGIAKKGQKVDKQSVLRASRLLIDYQAAIKNESYEVIGDED